MITLDRTDGGGLCGYLTDLDCLVVIVGKLAPGIIINAVVYADVNKAESEEALAALINDQAPDTGSRGCGAGVPGWCIIPLIMCSTVAVSSVEKPIRPLGRCFLWPPAKILSMTAEPRLW